MYRSTTGSTGGMYFNESSAAFTGNSGKQAFEFDIAYNQMVTMCDRRNQWEKARIDAMKARQNGKNKVE
jgi:hypothetical protein